MIDYSLKGKRIKLISCDDPYTKLKPGSKGTVEFILINNPSVCENQLCVNWDNGSNLSLLMGKDQYQILEGS